VVRDDQPDAREGQAGRLGVTERPVVCAEQRIVQEGSIHELIILMRCLAVMG